LETSAAVKLIERRLFAVTSVFVASLSCAVAATAHVPNPSPNRAQDVETRSAALHSLFADYWEDHLRHSPEEATTLGDKRYNDRWSDYSVGAINGSLRRSRDYIRRLGGVDTAGMSEQDKLSFDLLLRSLNEYQESVGFKEWEMPVNQIHGPHIDIPQLVAITPFEDAKDYDNYMSRLHRLPALFREITADMKDGIRDGRVPPKLVSEKVLAQVDDLVAIAPADSPFAAPIKKLPRGMNPSEQKRITAEISEAIAQDVLPAYRRFAEFLRTQYVPKGRTQLGIDSIPNGQAYYAFCIRRATTLDLTADQIHQMGLDEVERDEAEMLDIAKKLGYPDLESLGSAIKTNPKLHPTSKEQLLGVYRAFVDQMTAKLPQLFGTLPKAALVVEATPAYAEKQRPAASYDQGTPDGKRPGLLTVNTYKYAEIDLGEAESIAYHEGVPGHHLQLSIAQELAGLPEFRKQYYNTAYLEGWALYSERLGKDVGFYQDPYSDFGRLQGDIWRAIRLVVDTGLHAQHWTRQQVVDFFHDHSSVDEINVQRETDRYIAWPGQALGYKIGQLKLLDIRQRAQNRLGAQFDIRKFHDMIIDSGALPLDVLDKRANDWIAAAAAGTVVPQRPSGP
jgi:uncharacterized protein (DUF885 family)